MESAHHLGDLDLPADERPLAEPDPSGALLVERLRLGPRTHTELAHERDSHLLVPADRDMTLAVRDGGAHQLTAGRLVGGLDAHEPLPVPGATQELGQPGPDLAAGVLGPGLVGRVGQQVARHHVRRAGAAHGITVEERRVGAGEELRHVGRHGAGGEQMHAAAAQHDRLLVVEDPTRMVRRLAQVGRAGLGAEVGPQSLDHLVADGPALRRQRQQRHQLLRAPGGPVGFEDLAVADANPEPAEHLDDDVAVSRSHARHRC